MSIKMENWRKKVMHGDKAEACRRAGVTPTVYETSKIVPPENWTNGMLRVNIELKKIVLEREQFVNDETV
jgi:hypothetical protein